MIKRLITLPSLYGKPFAMMNIMLLAPLEMFHDRFTDYKKNFCIHNGFYHLLLIYFLLVIKIGAGVTVTGGKTGMNVPEYFNETNEVTITITLNGDQASGGSDDLSTTKITVHAGFSSENDNISITRSLEVIGFTLSSTGNDNTHTYTITNQNLIDRNGSEPTNKYFDLNIRFYDGSTDGWVDSDNDGVLDADGISVAAAVGNNASLTIGGALASGGSCDFGSDGRIVTILSAGDDAGISFTVVGTKLNGEDLDESITGANAGTATGTKYFRTVTGITAVGNPAGNVSAGVNTKKADADDIYAVNFPEDYLQYERNDPWLNLGVKRASDPPNNVSTFIWTGANNLDFSTQEVYIDPHEDLSNHTILGITYKNYIKFTDDNGTDYRYEIGGADASYLDEGAHPIDMTSNLEINTGTWTDNVGDPFVNGREYDFYFTIYDQAGNLAETSQNGFVNNRTFDGTAPTVVINGKGSVGGVTFGPGNNPITSNPTDDSSAPYYHTEDEDVIIYFNWQPETMYDGSFTNSDVQVNGVAWADDLRPVVGLENKVWYLTLNDMNLGNWMDGAGNTTITVAAGVTEDNAGNDNVEATPLVFRFDITAPTLAFNVPLMTDNLVRDDEKTAVVISGTSDAEDNQTVTLKISDRATPPNVRTRTATVTGGVWTHTEDISAMVDGDITVTAEVNDRAGNFGMATTWKLFFRQTAGTYLDPNTLWLTHNENDNTNNNFSILSTLDSTMLGPDGKFLFKILWPQRAGVNYNIWKQTSNPIGDPAAPSGPNAVVGYEAVVENFTENGWGGLEWDNGPKSLLDGSSNPPLFGDWYYAIGTKAAWNGGIPGFHDDDAEQKTELYVSVGTLVKDTDPPSIAIDDTLMIDNRVNNTEKTAVVISGTADTEDGQTVTLRIAGSPIGTTTVTDSVWTKTVNISSYADGDIVITADVSDLAGNPATTSIPRTLFKDTDPPSIAIKDTLMLDNIVSNSEQGAVVISGTADTEDNQTVTLTIAGSTTINDSATVTDSVWTKTVDITALDDGDITITADVSDLAGNPAPRVHPDNPRIVEKDAAPPTLAIDDLLMDDDIVNNSEQDSVVISGTSDAEGQTVTLRIGSTPIIATATVTVGGVWKDTVDISSLAEGDIIITADVTNQIGNVAIQATDTLVKDIVPPSIAIDDLLMGDDRVNNSEQGSVVFSGTTNAENDQIVTLRIGSPPIIANPIVTVGGVWTHTQDISSLAEGDIIITADVSDLAGNPATQDTTVINKDTTLPTLAIDDLLMGDDRVNNSEQGAVVISGTSDAEGQTVRLTIAGSTTINDSVIVTGGVWTHTQDISSLADGTITVTADVSDLAGNAATRVPPNNPRTLVKDTDPPSIAIGVIEDDDIVSNSEQAAVVISGTAETKDNQPVTLTITGPITTISATPTVMDSVWTHTENISGMADGTITVTADVFDIAGNAATRVNPNPRPVEKDTDPPLIEIGVIEDDDLVSNSEQAAVVISGTSTAEDGQTVRLTIAGSTTINDSVIVTGGVWTHTEDISGMADGDIIITADVFDIAGNAATQFERPVEKDTDPPSIAIKDTLMTDNIVNDAEDTVVVISGTTIGVEVGQTVTLTITGPPTIDTTTIVTVGGVWTHTEDISGMADGNIVITAAVSDLAGNPAVQATRTLVKDAALPSITIDVIENNDMANNSEQGAVVISGTTIGVEDGQTVTLTIAGEDTTVTVTGGVWTHTEDISSLADGNITITADVSDIAGNAAQATRILDKDTALPSIAIDDLLMGDDIVNDSEQAAVVISGTTIGVEDGQTVTLLITDGSTPPDSITTNPTVTGDVWTYTAYMTTLADGNIIITAAVSDLAGNAAVQDTTDINKDTVDPTLTIDNNLMGDDWVNKLEMTAVVISGTTDGDNDWEVDIKLFSPDSSFIIVLTAVVQDNAWLSSAADITGWAEGPLTINASVSDNAGNETDESRLPSDDPIFMAALHPTITINDTTLMIDNIVNNSEQDSVVIEGRTNSLGMGGQEVSIILQDIGTPPTEAFANTVVLDTNPEVGVAIGVWSTSPIDISSFYNGIITVKAQVSDQAGNVPVEDITTTLIKDAYFTIIESFTHDHLDLVVRDADTVAFTADFGENLDSASISIVFAPAGIEDISDSMVVTADASIWTYDWDVPEGTNYDGIVTLTIEGIDSAGNLNDVGVNDNIQFTIDNTRPVLALADDHPDTVVRDVDNVVFTADFGENLDSASISIVFAAEGIEDTSYAMIVDAGDASLWTFQWDVPAGSSYDSTATLTVVGTDTAGNSVDTNFVYTVDNINPTINIDLNLMDDDWVNNSEKTDVVISGTTVGVKNGQVVSVTLTDETSAHTTAIPLSATVQDSAWLTSLGADLTGWDDGILTITAAVTDVAGNPGDDVRLPIDNQVVILDTVSPVVTLAYNQYYVTQSQDLRIEAQFSEPVKSESSLDLLTVDLPKIKLHYTQINYPIDPESALIDSSGLLWYTDINIPPPPGTGSNYSGTVNVSVFAHDLAGNSVELDSINNGDTLYVDNLLPGATMTYENTEHDSVFNSVIMAREGGKAGDEIHITANFNKSIFLNNTNTDSLPLLNIFYNEGIGDSLKNIYSLAPVNDIDTSYTWSVTLPSGLENEGMMIISIDARDRTNITLEQGAIINRSVFKIDNSPPSLRINTDQDSIRPNGHNWQLGWINKTTESFTFYLDSIPYDTTLLLSNNGLEIQARNINRPVLSWATIEITDTLAYAASNGGDSLDVIGVPDEFIRSIDSLTAKFEPEVNLVHGDTIIFRLIIRDRVGNADTANFFHDKFIFDPYPPSIININSGNLFTADSLISTDSISAGWSGSADSIFMGYNGSGMAEYEYQILEYDTTITPTDTTILKPWSSVGLNEIITHTDLSLQHLHLYQLFVTAVDIAGNGSDTAASRVIGRFNSPPDIQLFTQNTAWEDSLYSAVIDIKDSDIITFLSDSFIYHIDWDTTAIMSPIEDVDYPMDAVISIDSVSGFITWTPSPLDTGTFNVQIIVTDAWGLADTLVYPLTIHPINDRPYFRSGEAWDLKYDLPDLPLPDITFFEDQDESYVINMTKYILDEDNDDYSDISWQAVIEDTISQPGYPRVSLVFGPGTTDRVKENLQLQYLPQYKFNSIDDGIIQHTPPDLLNRSTANPINITFKDSLSFLGDSTYAVIRSDSNYWAENIQITFIATDIHETFAVDSLLLDVVNINDRPQWTQIPDQQIFENDTLQFDIGTFVTDLDDTLLTFNTEIAASWTLINGSWTIDTTGANLTIIPPEYTSTDLGDTLIILPNQVWSGYAFIEIIVSDEQGASDTVMFRLDVAYVPRPHLTINVIQNNAFTQYFDVIITDTLQTARNVILDIENNRVHLDTLDNFTYLGHTLFQDPGTYEIEVYADALVGDTVVFRSVGLALARTLGRWTGFSPDGLFNVTGEIGAVNMDQSILVVDSTMFKKGYSGSYKLGYESQWFSNPVEVSLASYDDEQALYQRNSDNSWTELPSYSQQGRIKAYTDKMGYFRLGRKTVIVPGLTSLGQNYPNPFNPVTNITYDVGFVDGPQQQVNLSVYNLLGHEVVTLVNEQCSIGRHSIKWYGRDKSGVSVASGIYFVHMTTSAGQVQTKKVMLLR